MATEEDFTWEDDLMTKSYQRQESHLAKQELKIYQIGQIVFPHLLDSYGVLIFCCRLSKIHGKNYGKPIAGSASEKRSQEYQKNVIDEVASLCYQISLHGYKYI